MDPVTNLNVLVMIMISYFTIIDTARDIQTVSPVNDTTTVNIKYRLFNAIDEGNVTEVKQLALQIPDINHRNEKKETYLIIAAMFNNDKYLSLQMIKVLIENGANVTLKDCGGYTFLHRLVQDGSNLTPSQLHEIAFYLQSKNLLGIFNKIGGFSKAVGNLWGVLSNTTPLQLAVKNLEVESQTLSLLQRNGVDLNKLDSNQMSLFLYAIWGRRSIRFFKELADLEVNLDYRNMNDFNRILLHYAAIFGNKEEVEFFLEMGLDIINDVDSVNETPLHVSIWHGNRNMLEIVKTLVRHGADVNIRDWAGKTPLDRAIGLDGESHKDKEKVVEFLRNRQ